VRPAVPSRAMEQAAWGGLWSLRRRACHEYSRSRRFGGQEMAAQGQRPTLLRIAAPTPPQGTQSPLAPIEDLDGSGGDPSLDSCRTMCGTLYSAAR
jgi:hypothetical protein